jgi:hypothetical protein
MNETGFKKVTRTQAHATQRSVDVESHKPGEIDRSARVNKSVDYSAMRGIAGIDRHMPKFENFLKEYKPNGLEV